MKIKNLVVFVTVLAIAFAIIGTPQDKTKAKYFIYLLDARRQTSGQLEPLRLIAKRLDAIYAHDPNKYRPVVVVVRAAAGLELLRDYPALFDKFNKTREATSLLPIFFSLGKPYARTKKELRVAIDQSPSLKGEERLQPRRRLVIVRDSEGVSEQIECAQLDDDVIFALDHFLGIGLLVQDNTLEHLTKCVNTLPRA